MSPIQGNANRPPARHPPPQMAPFEPQFAPMMPGAPMQAQLRPPANFHMNGHMPSVSMPPGSIPVGQMLPNQMPNQILTNQHPVPPSSQGHNQLHGSNQVKI